MLLRLSEYIRACYDRAEEAERCAAVEPAD